MEERRKCESCGAYKTMDKMQQVKVGERTYISNGEIVDIVNYFCTKCLQAFDQE